MAYHQSNIKMFPPLQVKTNQFLDASVRQSFDASSMTTQSLGSSATTNQSPAEFFAESNMTIPAGRSGQTSSDIEVLKMRLFFVSMYFTLSIGPEETKTSSKNGERKHTACHFHQCGRHSFPQALWPPTLACTSHGSF